CEPLASSAHSRRQWSQQVQRLSALPGQATPARLDCRSLQRGQRGLSAELFFIARAGARGASAWEGSLKARLSLWPPDVLSVSPRCRPSSIWYRLYRTAGFGDAFVPPVRHRVLVPALPADRPANASHARRRLSRSARPLAGLGKSRAANG